MFYAEFISDKYDTPTVGAYDGRPQNFNVRAFETKKQRQEAIDQAWEDGGNGFKITRKQVVEYYGWDFQIYGEDLVVSLNDFYRYQSYEEYESDACI